MTKNIGGFLIYIFKPIAKWVIYLIITLVVFGAISNVLHGVLGNSLNWLLIQWIFDIIELFFVGIIIYEGLRMFIHGGKYKSIFPDEKEKLLTEILEETRKKK